MTTTSRWLAIALVCLAGSARPAPAHPPFASASPPGRPAAAAPAEPTPEEAALGIRAALDAMTRATLAGDQQAYLAHVWAEEPFFRKEQVNWAADFEHHVPAEFVLSIADEVTIAESWASSTLTMSWRMADPGSQERTVAWPARFVLTGGRWLYAGEAWDEVLGDGVIALCSPGLAPIGRDVTEVFPEVRAHVQEGFGVVVDHAQPVKIYGSMDHLQASIYLSYTDPLGGWNEPGEAVKILAGPGTRRGSLRVLLAHEFGHVCTFAMGDKAKDMPWWVAEGAAELAAEGFAGGSRDAERFVLAQARAGGLADWSKMADFRNTPDALMWHVYKQGQHMVGYISERFGRERRNAWLTEITRGRTIDEASTAALGVGFAQIDADWRQAVTEALADQNAARDRAQPGSR